LYFKPFLFVRYRLAVDASIVVPASLSYLSLFVAVCLLVCCPIWLVLTCLGSWGNVFWQVDGYLVHSGVSWA
jgi:hypothetical protein